VAFVKCLIPPFTPFSSAQSSLDVGVGAGKTESEAPPESSKTIMEKMCN
jgi:hypothetical protein